RVVPVDGNTIDVRVTYRVDVKRIGFGRDPDFEADIRRVDGRIIVDGTEIPGGTSFVRFSTVEEYVYTIEAPAWVRLELAGDDGDVEIENWQAPIELTLDDGDVEIAGGDIGMLELRFDDGDISLSDVAGELSLAGDDGDVLMDLCRFPFARIGLEDGDVLMRDCAGELVVTLDDGDVALFDVASERVELRGDDGDVRIDLPNAGPVDLDVELDDGDIDVVYAEGLSAEFLVTTDDGRVDVHSDGVRDYAQTEHRTSGTIGGGEGRIRIRTDDGDISVRRLG
ncbi:MAG: DUF4097 family beta strand repeat protein, partial [Candidatus Eisenbacteria bacterium]|nr:DUF4097 family beta strand repeat protein [Candidatus Eisenbacteria bacterium]